jgi:heat shock protein HspQ
MTRCGINRYRHAIYFITPPLFSVPGPLNKAVMSQVFNEPKQGGKNKGTVTSISRAQHSVGDLIHHRRFGYRGVVFDIDQSFQSTEEWYEAVAKSCPPKDKPWYHVLVHGAAHATYVAERNLERDESAEPISHPLPMHYFSRFEDERYLSRSRTN